VDNGVEGVQGTFRSYATKEEAVAVAPNVRSRARPTGDNGIPSG
jgi:hypothetical protein